MKNLKDIQNFYFVGIGGIGMSALARYVNLLGKNVFGYDKTSTALTDVLMSEGMIITFEDSVHGFLELSLENEDTLVVYTPAIPESNVLLRYFISENFNIIKRAKFLGEVTKDTLCLAVAGTHGKTTTSAILGHLMYQCDMPVTAFLGGIAEGYHSNFISNGTAITVVEADEFDRSFLQLSPDIACVTSMDADHLDIYGDANSIEESFLDFVALLPDANKLLHKKGLPLNGKSVAINSASDFEARNVRIEDGAYVFDLKTPMNFLQNLRFSLPGHHNLHNAITAMGMALYAGAPIEGLTRALASFTGVERRFSYKIKEENLVLIDDYAHHPTEINALYQAVHELYPDDQKLIVFQPHLFSRTRDFIDGFAKSLSRFDELLLLDIYPARELPIEGVTSRWLLEKCTIKNKKIVSKEGLSNAVKMSKCRIKLMVGAGDIGAEVAKIKNHIQDEG
jgi:UDP-N-acetylmuramate--alanine ligase